MLRCPGNTLAINILARIVNVRRLEPGNNSILYIFSQLTHQHKFHSYKLRHNNINRSQYLVPCVYPSFSSSSTFPPYVREINSFNVTVCNFILAQRFAHIDCIYRSLRSSWKSSSNSIKPNNLWKPSTLFYNGLIDISVVLLPRSLFDFPSR